MFDLNIMKYFLPIELAAILNAVINKTEVPIAHNNIFSVLPSSFWWLFSVFLYKSVHLQWPPTCSSGALSLNHSSHTANSYFPLKKWSAML